MSLLQYTSKEMFSSTELIRKSKNVFDKLAKDEIEKAIILRDGKPSFMLLDFNKYEELINDYIELQEKVKEKNLRKPEIIKDENAEPAVPGTNPESLIKQVFSKLPGCELKVGAIWIQEMDSTSTVEAPMIYTVESVDKDKVTFTFTIDKSKSKDTDAISDLQSGGKAIYNRKTGKLIETTNNSTMKGNSPQMGEFYMVSTTSIKAVK